MRKKYNNSDKDKNHLREIELFENLTGYFQKNSLLKIRLKEELARRGLTGI